MIRGIRRSRGSEEVAKSSLPRSVAPRGRNPSSTTWRYRGKVPLGSRLLLDEGLTMFSGRIVTLTVTLAVGFATAVSAAPAGAAIASPNSHNGCTYNNSLYNHQTSTLVQQATMVNCVADHATGLGTEVYFEGNLIPGFGIRRTPCSGTSCTTPTKVTQFCPAVGDWEVEANGHHASGEVDHAWYYFTISAAKVRTAKCGLTSPAPSRRGAAGKRAVVRWLQRQVTNPPQAR